MVCAMPNTSPAVTDSASLSLVQKVRVRPSRTSRRHRAAVKLCSVVSSAGEGGLPL